MPLYRTLYSSQSPPLISLYIFTFKGTYLQSKIGQIEPFNLKINVYLTYLNVSPVKNIKIL